MYSCQINPINRDRYVYFRSTHPKRLQTRCCWLVPVVACISNPRRRVWIYRCYFPLHDLNFLSVLYHCTIIRPPHTHAALHWFAAKTHKPGWSKRLDGSSPSIGFLWFYGFLLCTFINNGSPRFTGRLWGGYVFRPFWMGNFDQPV